MKNVIASGLAAVALAFAGAAGAAEVQVVADARGWIDSGGQELGGLDNSNYIAGFYCLNGICSNGVVEVRNYFTFDLSDIPDDLVSAALEVDTRWLREGGVSLLSYQLTSTSGLTFDLLGGGDVFGLYEYVAADDEQVRQITLNSAALSAIRAAAGGSFTLSGRVLAPANYRGEHVHFVFGNSQNSDRSRLLLTTASIPEPATWALMIAGFGAAGATLRRRKSAHAQYSGTAYPFPATQTNER